MPADRTAARRRTRRSASTRRGNTLSDSARTSPTTWPACAAAARRSSSSAKASTTTSTIRSQNRYATDVRQDDAQDAIAAATRANVSFYGVDPRGPVGLRRRRIEIGSLPDDPSLDLGSTRAAATSCARRRTACGRLSDETGGFAAVNSNDFAQRLRPDHPGQQQLLRPRLLLERHQARRPVPQRDRCG